MGRRLFTRKDWPLYALLLVALAGALLWLGQVPPAAQAVLEVEGHTVARRTLGALSRPEQVTVAGAGGVTLTVEFSREGARFLSSTCPDHRCVGAGLVSRAGESAICLPARAVLRMEGRADHDAETF